MKKKIFDIISALLVISILAFIGCIINGVDGRNFH